MGTRIPQGIRELDDHAMKNSVRKSPVIHPEQLFNDPLSNMSTQPGMSGIQGKHLIWKSLKQTE